MLIAKKKSPFTLMPLVALSALGLAFAVPAFSASTIHAAAPVRYATISVHAGDNLWALAAKHTADGGDVQAVVDQIVAANHLDGVGIVPGQRLRIPN